MTSEALDARVRDGAVGFSTTTAAFARFAVRAASVEHAGVATLGTLALRAQLATRGFVAALVSDGVAGYALYVPLADASALATLDERLTTFVTTFVTQHPGLACVPGAPRADRALVSASPYDASPLPYALRGPSCAVALPLRWNELGTFEHGSIEMEAAAERLAATDEPFTRAIDPSRARDSANFA